MRIALPSVISAAALAGCAPDAEIVDLGGETMGTRWRVRLVLPPDTGPATVRAAIEARLEGIVAEMSHWSATSLLSRFNRSAAGQWITLPPDFAHVIAAGLAIAAATGGAFDPALGRLVDLWGFGPMGDGHHAPRAAIPLPPGEGRGPVAKVDETAGTALSSSSGNWAPAFAGEGETHNAPTTHPPAETLDAARAASGWQRLSFSAPDRRLRQPGGLSLDLSGIAKGHAVDAVADLLDSMGIAHCLVEIGGELVGRGVRPGGMPWWVDLETPPGAAIAPLRIALHGLAVATSGDYRRGAHTIDPRTGRSTDNGVVSVSVIHATALAADAWATALTVLGIPDGLALATDTGIAARIVTRDDNGLCEHLSPALAAMIAD